MIKEYTQPEIELVKFTIDDIIATSDSWEGPLKPGAGGDGDGDGDGDLVDELAETGGDPLPDMPGTEPAEPETLAEIETEPETETLPEEAPEAPLE